MARPERPTPRSDRIGNGALQTSHHVVRAAWRLGHAGRGRSIRAKPPQRAHSRPRLQRDAGARTIIFGFVLEQRRPAMLAPAALARGSAEAQRLGAIAREIDDVSEIRVYDFFNHAVLVA
ncbi:MAG: hypothetical protein ACOY6K_20355 [Pseudomonadota bacterium]